jgi:hypothetical protein
MTTGQEIEALEAEVNYYRDRIALLRARLYRQGVGSNDRLAELERGLANARQRLAHLRTVVSSTT